LADRALALHGGAQLAVLVGGLGLGDTAHAVLASPRVARVEVVEYLAPVIGWLPAGRLPLAHALTQDDRLRVVQGDVYARLPGGPPQRWEGVLLDLAHPPA